jgi:hypothetical protein
MDPLNASINAPCPGGVRHEVAQEHQDAMEPAATTRFVLVERGKSELSVRTR